MSSAFGSKRPNKYSSDYTNVKKVALFIRGFPRFLDIMPVVTRVVSFRSEPGDSSRTIVEVMSRSVAASSGTPRILQFNPDPADPTRFIQHM